MAETVTGIFPNSEAAGAAIREFIDRGLANDVTVISQNANGEIDTTELKKDVSQGSAAGATGGAVVGGLAGLLTGVASLAIPGVGLVVLGPLAAFLTGLGAGAVTGGLVGALVDWGLPDQTARLYEDRLQAGEVLIGVTTDRISLDEARQVMENHQVIETITIHPSE